MLDSGLNHAIPTGRSLLFQPLTASLNQVVGTPDMREDTVKLVRRAVAENRWVCALSATAQKAST
jgi:hypothetical protein